MSPGRGQKRDIVSLAVGGCRRRMGLRCRERLFLRMEQQLPFGEWLRQRRIELDLTQWELAERVDCSRTEIQKIESGTRRPSKQVAELLAACLGIAPADRDAFVNWARLGSATAPPPSIPFAAPSSSQFSDQPVAAPRNEAMPPPIHLPRPLTSLIGREPEIEAIRKYLLRHDVRLLSLIGPPGVGKTRLSIAAAASVADTFPDGIHFVALETITDPHLIASAVADVLKLRPLADQPVLNAVAQRLRPQRVLLVLDNFEQVLDAGLDVLELICACPGLKVLVTSREALHVQGEWRFSVQPLELPDVRTLSENNLQVLARIPTLALFTQRAQAIQSDFDLTPGNALQVSEICTRLDGLPLAIELAATRVSSLSLDEILSGLGQVRLLQGNLRNLPSRQRTVRGAIDWSYELLRPPERALFRHLGVFAGGCTLAAIQAVCQAPDLSAPCPDGTADFSIVDGCQALIEKSLLRRESGKANRDREGRYVMLEVLREFAREKLRASGEEQAIRRRHAEYYAALAEDTRSGLDGPKQGELLQALDAESDNIRAVFGWSLETGPETAEIALRLGGALGRFWMVRSYANEGRVWVEQALKAAASVATIAPFVRIRALTAAGGLANEQGDYLAARPLREQALSLAQEHGDKRVIATCLLNVGSTLYDLGEYSKATTLYEQALTLHRDIGNRVGIGVTLFNMGWAARMQGDRARARELYQECLALRRELGDQYGIANTLGDLGAIAVDEEVYDRARVLLNESLSIRQEINDERGAAFCLVWLARLANAEHRYAQACEGYRDGLILYQKIGDRGGIISCLEWLPELCVNQEQILRGVRLWGAANALRQAGRTSVAPVERARYQEAVARARRRLGEKTFARAWSEGSAFTMEDASKYALEFLRHAATGLSTKRKKGTRLMTSR